jgi:hypothetical protein
MLKIISFITGRKIVYLLHDNNKVTMTIEDKKPKRFSDKKTCYVDYFYRVSVVTLNADGTTYGQCHIKKWSY